MEKDILGTALWDFHSGNYTEDIITYSSLDEKDVMPLPYLFRSYEEMPPLEQKALALCKGSVLDIGCGAGNHSLYLQEKGFPVACLDHSLGAIAVCKARGVHDCHTGSLLDFDSGTYDTLLLLMNGIGITGTLKELDAVLNKLKALLNEGGQVILDSSDIIYMFDTDDDGGYWIPDNAPYYGEVRFTMEYLQQKSDEFPWLYLDFNTLQKAANYNGMRCELIAEGEHYNYLARLSVSG